MVLNSLQTWLHRAHNLFNLPSLKWFLVKCCGIICFTKLHGVDTEIHSVKTLLSQLRHFYFSNFPRVSHSVFFKKSRWDLQKVVYGLQKV